MFTNHRSTIALLLVAAGGASLATPALADSPTRHIEAPKRSENPPPAGLEPDVDSSGVGPGGIKPGPAAGPSPGPGDKPGIDHGCAKAGCDDQDDKPGGHEGDEHGQPSPEPQSSARASRRPRTDVKPNPFDKDTGDPAARAAQPAPARR